MILFNNIYIQGFGSISEPLEFSFINGINIVVGKNGSGKSTIFNAILWCIYGNTSKDILQGDIVSKNSTDGCIVKLDLTINGVQYSIIRTIKYGDFGTSLSVYKEDVKLNALHISDNQAVILDILKIDYKTFISSVFFGQRMKRFIEGSSVDKREILESLIDTSVLDTALINCKTACDDLKLKLVEANAEYDKLTSENELLQQMLESNAESVKEFEQNKNSKIADLNNKISELKAPTGEFRPVDSRRTMLPEEHLIEPVKPKEICHVCGARINKSKLADLMNNYKLAMIEFANKETALKELKTLNNDIVEHNKLIDENIMHNAKLKMELDSYSYALNLLNEQLEYVVSSKPSTIDLDKLTSSISNNLNRLESLENDIEFDTEYLKICSWWKDHGFSNKGIKSFILNSILINLNKHIRKYSEVLGFYVEFSIDNTKASKPFITKCWNGEYELNYDQFSGGEKARIDISTALAMHDLVNSKFNLLVMDEVFEGLDKDGVEDVFGLIRMKSNNSVYIITHNEIDSLGVNLINVKKSKSTYIDE